MIFASDKGIKIVLVFVLFGFFLLTIYFINEVKKIENIYDQITIEQLTGDQ